MVEYDPTEIHGSTLAARDAERVAPMLADMTSPGAQKRRRSPSRSWPPGRGGP
jgi:hypothetical protein